MTVPRPGGIRRRALIALVLLGLVPQIAISFVEDAYIRRFTEKQVELSVSQVLDHLIFSVSGTLQSFVDLAIHTATNHSVIRALQEPLDTPRRRERAWAQIRAEIFRSEKTLGVVYPFDYLVAARDGTVFTNFFYTAPQLVSAQMPALRAAAWYGAPEGSLPYVPFFTMEKARDYLNPHGAEKLYFVQTIAENWEPVGVVAVGVSTSAVSRLLDALHSDERDPHTTVFLVSEEGDLVVAGETNEWSAATLGPEGPFEAAREEARHWKIGRRRYFLFSRELFLPSVGKRFRVLAATPGSAYYQNLGLVRIFYFVLLSVTFAMVGALILIIQRQIVIPIVRLNERVKRLDGGLLESGPAEERRDEIGELGRSFNQMVGRLAGYIESIRESEAAKRALEIRFLQSQMKPHFVRNTLNTIRWMAQIRGARGIENAVMSFSRMLGYLLSDGQELVSVREELDYIEQYLFLQKIRYQNKVAVEMSFQEAVLEQRVPRLIFQPIIENSILHGLAVKNGGGRLSIQGSAADGTVRILFADDGVGMTGEVLRRVREELEAPSDRLEGSGIGLANVQRRIRHYFGEGFGLEVDSRRGEGTRVVVRLPRLGQGGVP